MEQKGVVIRMKGMNLQEIDARIHHVRGRSVMLDSELAALYGVPTKQLNQSVRRNSQRFPDDFMFRLSHEEMAVLRSQSVTLEAVGKGRHRKYLAYGFTEQGVAMLSGVLRSERAVLESAEKTLDAHGAALGEHEKALRTVFDEIRGLLAAPAGPRRRIGFR